MFCLLHYLPVTYRTHEAHETQHDHLGECTPVNARQAPRGSLVDRRVSRVRLVMRNFLLDVRHVVKFVPVRKYVGLNLEVGRTSEGAGRTFIGLGLGHAQYGSTEGREA